MMEALKEKLLSEWMHRITQQSGHIARRITELSVINKGCGGRKMRLVKGVRRRASDRVRESAQCVIKKDLCYQKI